MTRVTFDGAVFAGMVRAGAANLHLHMEEVNDLNVFPIPDGDTGENMMLTMRGGVNALEKGADADLSVTASAVADGMLMGARGNSGVILSQFFAGIAEGLQAHATGDVAVLEKAIACGVGCAFESVSVPTPGTILTVIKDAGNYAAHCNCDSIKAYFAAFVEEAERSLARTPELLPVLREAGVVDSGGAGLLYVAKGMYAYLCGEEIAQAQDEPVGTGVGVIDPDLFGADSVMEFGYCTECLLRLQHAKTNIAEFEVATLTDYLNSIGDSVVAVKNDSIVKLHVHTMTPYKVLEYCQRFGEFLTVKIENMMLQHNETVARESAPAMSESVRERKPYGIVTVASGEGIKATFCEMGADEVIHGGQTMNPGTEDFIHAFDRVNADTVFVLPNNGNVIMAAQQAAGMYASSDVRVIPTRSIGDGYAVLSMLDLDRESADEIEEEMKEAMQDVVTVEISKSIRDADMNGVHIQKGDYLAIAGKEILAAGQDREAIACAVTDTMDIPSRSVILIICGMSASIEEGAVIESHIKKQHPFTEVCLCDGGQDVYDYILVAE